MDKLKELIELCKGSIELTINEHRDAYQSVTDQLFDFRAQAYWCDDLAPEIEAKMIELDTMISLHYYPDSPVGFNVILHYDLEMAIDQAIKQIKDSRGIEDVPAPKTTELLPFKNQWQTKS